MVQVFSESGKIRPTGLDRLSFHDVGNKRTKTLLHFSGHFRYLLVNFSLPDNLVLVFALF